MRVSFPFLSILAYPSMVGAQRLQKHSHAVWTDFSSSQPQAIAIVLGHLGVSDHTLHRYAKWYVNRSSSVVAASSPPHIFARNGSLRDTTEQILAQTVRALHQAESNSQAPRNLPPIVVHLFSNGGAFFVARLREALVGKVQQRLRTGHPETSSPTTSAGISNIRFLSLLSASLGR